MKYLWLKKWYVQFFEFMIKTNKKFKKLKTALFSTLLRSQKHNIIFSNTVLRENITRKQFKRWLGRVSISQTALGYAVMRTQSKY